MKQNRSTPANGNGPRHGATTRTSSGVHSVPVPCFRRKVKCILLGIVSITIALRILSPPSIATITSLSLSPISSPLPSLPSSPPSPSPPLSPAPPPSPPAPLAPPPLSTTHSSNEGLQTEMKNKTQNNTPNGPSSKVRTGGKKKKKGTMDWSKLTPLERFNPKYSPIFTLLTDNDDDEEKLTMPSIQVHLIVDLTTTAPSRTKNETTAETDNSNNTSSSIINNNTNSSNSTSNSTTTTATTTNSTSDGADAAESDSSEEGGKPNPASEFLLDGVKRSPYVQLTGYTTLQPKSGQMETLLIPARSQGLPLVYLVDWGSMDRDCHRLQLMLETVQLRRNENLRERRGDSEDKHPHVLLVDFSASSRPSICPFLMDTFGKKYKTRVRLAKRSIVQGRYFDFKANKLHRGSLLPPSATGTRNQSPDNSQPILHSPLVLRESFVEALVDITTNRSLSISEHDDRPVDVAMFWKRGDYSHYGFYRREITESVKTLHHSNLTSTIRLETRVGVAYTDKKEMEEGGLVQYQYVEELLSTKIVVIAQRDEWEDHYRLMESLASGALVMSDPMIAPPAGLKDKVNIVFYDSPKTLRNLIRYYLHPDNEAERNRIALRGYELAMGRHRSWHRIEELLFGRPLTNVDDPLKAAPPTEEPSIFATSIEEGHW